MIQRVVPQPVSQKNLTAPVILSIEKTMAAKVNAD